MAGRDYGFWSSILCATIITIKARVIFIIPFTLKLIQDSLELVKT